MEIDVKETDKGYHLNCDLPGLCKNDIKLSVNNNVLLISAERKVEV
jgi:HSP20 family protein